MIGRARAPRDARRAPSPAACARSGCGLPAFIISTTTGMPRETTDRIRVREEPRRSSHATRAKALRPSRAACRCGKSTFQDAAARKDTSSCSTCRRGSSDRLPPANAACRHLRDLAGSRSSTSVEQRREGVAEVEAAPAAVADVEHALQLVQESAGVEVISALPVEWDGASVLRGCPRVDSGPLIRGLGRGQRLAPRACICSRSIRCRACPAPSGSDSRASAPPSPASRTSPRSRRSLPCARPSPCPDTCPCIRASRRRSPPSG